MYWNRQVIPSRDPRRTSQEGSIICYGQKNGPCIPYTGRTSQVESIFLQREGTPHLLHRKRNRDEGLWSLRVQLGGFLVLWNRSLCTIQYSNTNSSEKRRLLNINTCQHKPNEYFWCCITSTKTNDRYQGWILDYPCGRGTPRTRLKEIEKNLVPHGGGWGRGALGFCPLAITRD